MQLLQRLQIFICFIFFPFSVLPQSYAVISGKILHAGKDSLSFIYNARGQGAMVKAPLINDSFYIRLNINSPAHLDITDGVQYISGLIEPTDSITIKADFSSDKMYPKFTGRGKGKFLYNQLYKPLFPLINERLATARFQTIPTDYLLDIIDSIENSYVQALTDFKQDMSEDAYLIFKGDLEGVCWQLRSSIHFLLYNIGYEALVKRNSDSISAKFRRQFESFLSLNEDYRYSGIYILTVVGTLETLFNSHHPGKEHDIEFKYDSIRKQLPVGLQVPVISRLLNGDMVARRDKDAIESVIDATFTKPEDSLVKANFIKTLNNLY